MVVIRYAGIFRSAASGNKRAAIAIILFGALLATAPRALSDSTGKIVGRSIKALGGKDALLRIRSWQAQGTVVRIGDGASGIYRAAGMLPNLYTAATNIDGVELSEGFNGKSAWRKDSRQGPRTLTGAASAQVQVQAIYRNHGLFDYKKDQSTVVYEGTSIVRNKSANIIGLATSHGVKIRIHLDTGTGLPLREELPDETGVTSYEYDDYRLVEGVMRPFSIAGTINGERYEIKIDRIIFNSAVRSADFDFPIVPGEQAPDLPALMASLRDHQSELDRLRENYGYTETITSRTRDKQGNIKEADSETYDISFHKGHRVRRMVARNGRPLSQSDLEKEDRRIEKEILNAEEGKPIDVPHNERGVKISQLLRSSRFVKARRERFRGRDVVVCEFEPDPAFKSTTYDEQFLRKIAGTIWIDASDLQVARVELYLVDSFKVGRGMVFAMKPGSRFVGEQERFNDEMWLPTYTEVTIAARAMTLINFEINQKSSYTQYRRFDVNSKEKLGVPAEKKIP